jgi:hypothetical protein
MDMLYIYCHVILTRNSTLKYVIIVSLTNRHSQIIFPFIHFIYISLNDVFLQTQNNIASILPFGTKVSIVKR